MSAIGDAVLLEERKPGFLTSAESSEKGSPKNQTEAKTLIKHFEVEDEEESKTDLRLKH
jgi:hypothetical protein